jgi:hypothetical protein
VALRRFKVLLIHGGVLSNALHAVPRQLSSDFSPLSVNSHKNISSKLRYCLHLLDNLVAALKLFFPLLLQFLHLPLLLLERLVHQFEYRPHNAPQVENVAKQ